MATAFLFFFALLLGGFALFYGALRLAETMMGRRVSVNVIFKDLKKKMWMTVGLGTLFFSVYLLIVVVARFLLDSNARLDLFFLLHRHSISFVYLGLLIFATVSVSIYLVRIWIKYLYNRKHKEDQQQK
jgi:hypothetical protein